jgi:hypothetical protein
MIGRNMKKEKKMKLKLLMACAVLAVGSAMASNVKWGISSGTLNAGVFEDGSIMYLVWNSVDTEILSYTGGVSDQTGFSIAKLTDKIAASGILADGTYLNATGVSIVPTDLDTTAGNKPFYLVVISKDGLSMAVAGNTKNVNIQTSALSATPYWLGSDFTTYTAVPEPSSTALLALGVAAVGLRRRFRR